MAATLGAAYTLDGRVVDALPLLTQAMDQAVAQDTRGLQTFCLLSLAEAQLAAGRRVEAHGLAERVLALAGAYQEQGSRAYALRLLGAVATDQDPRHIAPAASHFRQAITLTKALGMRPLLAHCHRSLGTLYVTIGQQEQARTALSTAVAMYRAMNMTFWLPQTEAVLAQVETR